MPSRLPNRFHQIADDLRAGIRDGTYPLGNRLPSESTLAASYGATMATARLAYDLLKAEGLVRGEQGRGIFVAHRFTLEERLTKCLAENDRLRGELGR